MDCIYRYIHTRENSSKRYSKHVPSAIFQHKCLAKASKRLVIAAGKQISRETVSIGDVSVSRGGRLDKLFALHCDSGTRAR